jgi:hypothetical protein
MLNDPRTVAGLADAAEAVGTPASGAAGAATAEQRDRLAELRGRLYDTVGRFTALPAADPGRSDAAFCLFLHVHASTPLRTRPEWPAIAACSLGLQPADEPGPR